MRDILWLVGIAVFAMFGLTATGLGHMPLPIGQQTLADWIRTVAAVGALVLGVAGYRNWRTQERAKRDAGLAEDLLVAAYKAANATRALRRQGWPFRKPITKAELRVFRDSYGATDFSATRELVDEVRGRLATAKIVFGKETASTLSVVPRIFQQAVEAKKELDFLSLNCNPLGGISDEEEVASERWQSEAERALKSLGAYEIIGAAPLSSLLMNWDNDAGEKAIADSLVQLEKNLERHIKLAVEGGHQ
jgi:hypothetical protein